jgi:hypothetical protein
VIRELAKSQYRTSMAQVLDLTISSAHCITNLKLDPFERFHDLRFSKPI